MTLRMRAEVRDAWADALESGKYEQTTGVLTQVDEDHNIVGMCCLGVLCDLAVQAGVIDPPEVTYSEEDGESALKYDGAYTVLPRAVAEWAGLRLDNNVVPDDPHLTNDDGRVNSAASWNDDQRATFDDIAAMVRRIQSADDPAEVQA